MIRLPIRGSSRLAGARQWALAVTLVGSFFQGTYAHAQGSATDRLLARSLFEQGRDLMAAGKYSEACPKLAESQRLDPAPGTQLNMAVCHEKEGRTATAYVEFLDALTQARRDARPEREKLARERIAALEPILSRLTVNVGQGADAPGLEVRLDGAVVSKPAWGVPSPTDPGDHEVLASAPGKKRWASRVTMGPNADRKTVTVPVLEDATAAIPASTVPPPPSASQVAAPPPEVQPSVAPPPSPPPAPQGSSPIAGYVVGGVGLVALGVGGYFGLRAFSKWSERNDHCPNGACDAAAVAAGDDATTAANISNVGIGLGLVGIGVGTYLVLTSGSRKTESPKAGQLRVLPAVGTSSAGMTLGGRF